MKKGRNIGLLVAYRQVPCVVCGCLPSDPHHIKTRGSGGPDEDWNLLALCRRHHTEWHTKGWYTFSTRYQSVLNLLQEKGWDCKWKQLYRKVDGEDSLPQQRPCEDRGSEAIPKESELSPVGSNQKTSEDS